MTPGPLDRDADGLTRREQSERTREALLGAGLDILREEPAALVFDRLDAKLVAGRVGVTAGAFYHHFDGADGLVEALLQHSLLAEQNRPFAVAVPRFEALVADGASFVEAFVAGAAEMTAWQERNITFELQVAVWAKRSRSVEVIRRLRRMYAMVSDETGGYYASMLTLLGRELRPPYTLGDLADTFIAVFEGFSLRRGVDPEGMPPGRLGEVLVSVLALMTRETGDGTDAADWLAAHGPQWRSAEEP